MKYLLSFFLFVSVVKADYPVKCSQLDFVYSTSNCCNENNDATCLQAIPHQDYTSDINRLEGILTDIGLCSVADESCIKDLPSLEYIRSRIKNITDGGVEIAVAVANSKQNAHANLDAIVADELPTLSMKSGSTLTIESGATLEVQGTLDIPQLTTGLTQASATQINHLNVAEIHSAVDFNNHLLSEVNIVDLQIDGVAVSSTSAEINILSGIDAALTSADINKIYGLNADASELNALHNSGVIKADVERLVVATPGETAPNKVVTTGANGDVVFKHNVEIDGNLDIPYGQLKINGVVIDKTAAELNDAVAHFVGLTASTAEINQALTGITSTVAELNKLHLVTADATDFNRLDITLEGTSENGKVVTADSTGKVIFAGNVDVAGTLDTAALEINNVPVTATAAEINIMDTVTATAEELNRLDIQLPGQSEPNKALVPDSESKLVLNGHLEMGSSEVTTTIPTSHTLIASTQSCDGSEQLYGTADATFADTAACRDRVIEVLADGGRCKDTVSPKSDHSVHASGSCSSGHAVSSEGEGYDCNAVTGAEFDALYPDGNDLATTVASTAALAADALANAVADAGICIKSWKNIQNARTSGACTGFGGAWKTGTFSGQFGFSGSLWTKMCTTGALSHNGNPGTYIYDVFTNSWDAITSTGASFLHDASANTCKVCTADTPTTSGGSFDQYSFVVGSAVTSQQAKTITVPEGSLVLGSVPVTASAAELNILDGINPDLTASDLSAFTSFTGDWGALDVLSGVTSTNTELNYLDIAELGKSEPSKAVTTDADNKAEVGKVVVQDELNAQTLAIGGIPVTISAAQLNQFDGLTADVTMLNKLTGLDVNSADLNKLKDVTADAADLNRADITTVGETEASKVVTADANGDITFKGKVIIDGVIEVADGQLKIGNQLVTATAGEVNAMNGVTSSASEINYLSGITLGQSAVNKVLSADANGKVKFNGDVEITGDLDIPAGKLSLGGVVLDASHDGDDISDATNHFLGLTVTASELNVLDDIQATTAELNKLHGVTSTTAELNYVAGITLGQAAESKALSTDATNKLSIPNLEVTTSLDTAILKIGGVAVSATVADLNKLSGLTVSSTEINVLDGYTGDASDLSKLDGLTASAAELSKLDGLDAALTSAHLNVMKDVTATAVQLNSVDGLTATVAQLDKLKDLTATAAELNALAGVTPGTVTANKAAVADANGAISSAYFSVTDTLAVATLKLNGVAVTASAEDLNSVADLSSHEAKLLDLATVTSTSAEIDSAVAKAALVSAADLTKLSAITASSTQLNTCGEFLLQEAGETPTCTVFGQMIVLTKGNGDTELHFCKAAGSSIGPLA
jgi:hypothetical protein